MGEDLVYTVKEASQLLKISPSTVARRVRDGSIPSLGWKGKILIPGTFFKSIQKG